MWSSIVFIFATISAISSSMDVFKEKREALKNEEFNLTLGSDVVLSDTEQKANEIIMNLKNQELSNAYKFPQMFNYSKHFFDYKEEVKKNPLYKLIQRMPKGAVLHIHDTGLLSPDYMVKLTYWENLYICYSPSGIQFTFSKGVPVTPCDGEWKLVKNLREASANVQDFDAELRKHFTLLVDKPNEVYTDINKVWSKFQDFFICTSGLMTYKPVWDQYFYDTLKAFREDNVMYIEIRSVLPQLYDLDGNVYDSVATAHSYKKVLDRFVGDYPDFFGAKLIYAPMRRVDANTVKDYIKTAKVLKKELPGFLAGFDLVGQEDLGAPLIDFVNELLGASNDLDFFFHAAETNWYGTNSDENLIDAILLNTKRIGHGFGLVKHPVLMEEVRKRNIAIEVNVISNAVLKLVDDVRNHPLATFLARGLPVVISSDDPGVWEAEPLTHDFFVAFVGVASCHADLRTLKKLALNSLYYSTYPDKQKIVYEFEVRWTKFINSVVKGQW